MEFAICIANAFACSRFIFFRMAENDGTAMAARMAMIEMTTRSSTSVNARRPYDLIVWAGFIGKYRRFGVVAREQSHR